MRKIQIFIRLALLPVLLVFASSIPDTVRAQNNEGKPVILEILTWQARSSSVSDDQMITAVQGLVKDLKTLKGFQNQTLYKDSDGTWIDIYYWDSEHDAHASNDAMADKASLARLIELIKPGSITIKVMTALQSSGKLPTE